MREISYNSKNQGFWLVETVFLAQLCAPEPPPFAIPYSYSSNSHSFIHIPAFIYSFLFSASTDCLLTVC